MFLKFIFETTDSEPLCDVNDDFYSIYFCNCEICFCICLHTPRSMCVHFPFLVIVLNEIAQCFLENCLMCPLPSWFKRNKSKQGGTRE